MGPQMNGWRRHRWWIGPKETFRQQVICNWLSTHLPAIKRVFCFCICLRVLVFAHVCFITLVWQLNLNSNWNWRWFQFWTIVQLWSLSIVKVVELPRLNEIGLLYGYIHHNLLFKYKVNSTTMLMETKESYSLVTKDVANIRVPWKILSISTNLAVLPFCKWLFIAWVTWWWWRQTSVLSLLSSADINTFQLFFQIYKILWAVNTERCSDTFSNTGVGAFANLKTPGIFRHALWSLSFEVDTLCMVSQNYTL